MNRIKRLVTESPLAFGLIMTFVYILLAIMANVLGAVWPGEMYRQYIGGTIGRVVSITILIALLFRLGWLRPAGFTQPGRRQTWLITLLLLAYWIPVSAYAMTGNLDFRISDPALASLLTLFYLTRAFLEEVVFRGLILYAFVAVWGSTTPGLIKSVLVASLFFGGMHLVNFLGGNPLPAVLLQSGEAFFLGILLGSLVLSGNSIYPAAFFHGLVNLVAFLNLLANASEGAAISSWLLLNVLMFPLAAFGIYILRGIRQRSIVPDVA